MITNYFLWSVTCPVYPWALLLHMTIQQCGLGSVAAQTNGSSESGREEELGQSETEEENHFCPQVWQSHSCRRIPHGRKWAEQWSGVGWGGGGGVRRNSWLPLSFAPSTSYPLLSETHLSSFLCHTSASASSAHLVSSFCHFFQRL